MSPILSIQVYCNGIEVKYPIDLLTPSDLAASTSLILISFALVSTCLGFLLKVQDLMTRFVSRNPMLFSVLAIVLAVVLIKLLDAGLTYLNLSDLANRIIVETLFCGYVILLLASLHWWHEAGFKQAKPLYKLLAFLPLLFLPLLVIVTNGLKAASASQVIWFIGITLMVGFAEEGLLRGVILRALLPGGMMRAALLSSLFFGIGHLFNILQGASPTATIVQMIYSTLLGIGFAGVRLYTGTIWPAILAHTLIDFIDIASRGFVLTTPQSVTLAGAIVPIIITGLYAGYGWWLIRHTPISNSTILPGIPPISDLGRI